MSCALEPSPPARSLAVPFLLITPKGKVSSFLDQTGSPRGRSIDAGNPASVSAALALNKSPHSQKFKCHGGRTMKALSMLIYKLLAVVLLMAPGCSPPEVTRHRKQEAEAPWPWDNMGGFYGSERIAAAKRQGYVPKNFFDLAPLEVETLEHRARAGDKESAKRLGAYYLMAGYDESKAIYFKQLAE